MDSELNKKYEMARDMLCELEYLDNGVWDVSDAEVVFLGHNYDPDYVLNLLEAHKGNIVIGEPYNTDMTVLVIGPYRPHNAWKGQFNYGACGLVENCPKKILVLAQND